MVISHCLLISGGNLTVSISGGNLTMPTSSDMSSCVRSEFVVAFSRTRDKTFQGRSYNSQ